MPRVVADRSRAGRRPVGPTLATTMLVLSLGACSGSGGDPVTVAAAQRADVAEVVQAPATVAARASATLSAPAAGTLRRLLVHDGQRVRAGQVLAVVDSPSARADLVRARRALAQAGSGSGGGGAALSLGSDAAAQRAFAQAGAATSSVGDARARQAAAAGLAQAKAQYLAARDQAAALLRALQRGLGSAARVGTAVAAAQRAQGQAQVLAAQRTVDALTLVAPLTGVVSLGSTAAPAGAGAGDLLAQLPESVRSAVGATGAGAAAGASTAAGSGGAGEVAAGVPVAAGAPLLSVTDTSALSLTAEVDETDVLQVHPGVTATAELDALPGSGYDAVVDSVGMTPTTSARGGVTYPVRLRLLAGTDAHGAPAPRPRPGMSVVVSLRVRQDRDAVAVPAAAVVRDGPRDTVYVVRDGRAHRRDVVLGAQGDQLVAVASGLDAGERVVVRGADAVHDGQRVPR